MNLDIDLWNIRKNGDFHLISTKNKWPESTFNHQHQIQKHSIRFEEKKSLSFKKVSYLWTSVLISLEDVLYCFPDEILGKSRLVATYHLRNMKQKRQPHSVDFPRNPSNDHLIFFSSSMFSRNVSINFPRIFFNSYILRE